MYIYIYICNIYMKLGNADNQRKFPSELKNLDKGPKSDKKYPS